MPQTGLVSQQSERFPSLRGDAPRSGCHHGQKRVSGSTPEDRDRPFHGWLADAALGANEAPVRTGERDIEAGDHHHLREGTQQPTQRICVVYSVV